MSNHIAAANKGSNLSYQSTAHHWSQRWCYLLHFQSLKIGDRIKEGDHLFVMESNLTAAEFYSPLEGCVDSVTGDPTISDWLVTLKPREM